MIPLAMHPAVFHVAADFPAPIACVALLAVVALLSRVPALLPLTLATEEV